MKVLLVEDDEDARKILKQSLKVRGHEVTDFGDAEAAWEACQGETYPLIVLDWILPGMDGVELCRRIRALPLGHQSVILIITSRNHPEDLTAVLDAGANDYFVKPIQTKLLAVRFAIAERHVADLIRRAQVEADFKARARQQVVVAEFGQRALLTNDLNDLLEQAVKLVAGTLEMEYCKVLEVVSGGQCFRLLAGSGWDHTAASATIGAGVETQAGYTVLTGQPVVVDDFTTDTKFQGDTLLLDHGIVSGMTAIIHSQDKPWGVLGVYTKRHKAFTKEDTHFLQAVANVLATAIERRQAEETLRSSLEQLRQSQKMEAIGRLAGGIAHDFNNLLTAILGYSELLLACLGPHDLQRKHVEEIKKAGDWAASLTRQLLAFSRRQVLQPKVLDLNGVVNTMDRMLRRVIGEDIDLVPVLDPALKHVKADPGQIEQVIMNLAVNARDAMPEGGQLTVETSNVMLDQAYANEHAPLVPGPYVMLAVSDTGIGIPAETQARIFEPFFTTKERGKGTGLGLATVYGIVKQSDGYIFVRSRPGQGTCFTIYLPSIDEPVEAPAPPPPLGCVGGSETVLLVEDEEIVRSFAHEVLTQNGYTVLVARHGHEALAISEQHTGPISLMVTDVVMPGMSGKELAVRFAPIRPDMRVLYISGYPEEAGIRPAALDNATAYLQKPFTPDVLTRKVREVLDGPADQVAT